ncbi:MAG: flagellar motor protein MotB [Gammaproteobacteria bacterium]
MLTFADLMSLLLAFFVLLFSFSEMDKQKYKQVAGSMREAFGIQREIKIKEPPKGINIIAQEFSAGTPDPTVMNSLRQHTTDDFMQYLKMPKKKGELEDKLKKEGERLRMALADEIESGFVEIEVKDATIVVRILEKGSFATASDTLIEPFRTVLEKMGQTIGDTPGQVVVAGHSDNVPILNRRFRSNWELSSARAVTVVHALMRQGSIPSERFRIEGYADTRPVESNDTRAGRARNRRVEVTLLYDNAGEPAGNDLQIGSDDIMQYEEETNDPEWLVDEAAQATGSWFSE